MFALPAGWKPFSLGALAGAVIITWTGFDALGWKTSAAAETLGKRQADAAVVTALASICNEQFRKAADFPARLAALYLGDEPTDADPPETNYRIGVRARNLELEIIWIGSVLFGRRRHSFLPVPRRWRASRCR